MSHRTDATLTAGACFGLALLVLAFAAMPGAEPFWARLAAGAIGVLGILQLTGCWLAARDHRRRPR